jgi:hypothetical protein
MERNLPPREIPAAWASSLTAEVWHDIVQKRRNPVANSSLSHSRRWILRHWKSIVVTVSFWALCLLIYVELVVR